MFRFALGTRRALSARRPARMCAGPLVGFLGFLRGKSARRGVLLGTFVVRTRSAVGMRPVLYAAGAFGGARRRPWVRPSGTEPCSGPCPASARTARARWNSRGFEGFVLERRQDSGFDGGGGGAATKSVRRSRADVRRGARVARVLHGDQAHAVVDDAPGARERPRSRGRVSTTRATSPILLSTPGGPTPVGHPATSNPR